MNKDIARDLLHQFDFKALFLDELGWDDHNALLTLEVGGETVTLKAIAEKRGFGVFLCTMPGQGCSYDYQTRCRIEAELAKNVREHLIIYADQNRRFQIWQWVKREAGKPVARREHMFTASQSGEALLQKIQSLVVKLEEEEELTLVGIATRARQAFDVDRVTRGFYDRFKTEHAAFLKQIKGINDKGDCEWYASIMLNRLKFVYFIQKKGFLDQDKDYLRNRLTMIQQTRSKTNFLSFYRAFLLKLFHDGLGRRERSAELRDLLGTVPYLNGGIFAVHPLEEKHTGIDIPDEAFKKIFDFFDQYQWHLDERPLRADNEINPDVLGYIFEKYINQKQMGAYYTKEDITEYIAKNCIIPYILDCVEADLNKKKSNLFSALFKHLTAEPDRYIYDPVKHGVGLPLPPEIARGVDTQKPDLLERRAAWNEPAPSEYALPTEIWREVVARRQRYWEVWSRLSGREFKPEWVATPPSSFPSPNSSFILPPIHPSSFILHPSPIHPSSLTTNDLITLNLNIRQFAQDCIENAATPEVLWAFWQAIEQITVLDPTCGSGAFLFAAVNILEPLYEACLDRMKAFMLEWSQAPRIPHPNYYKEFAAVIAHVEKHANEKYFVFKSIIIHNLYGVDIMDEAVEICKLRLFLKLAAQLEPDYAQDNLGIEPLPDIDFNIRAGNTLVGYTTAAEVRRVFKEERDGQGKLMLGDTAEAYQRFEEQVEITDRAFQKFRQMQTEHGMEASDFRDAKMELRRRLAELDDELSRHMAKEYGVDVEPLVHSKDNSHMTTTSISVAEARQSYRIRRVSPYHNWLCKHQPFHWFVHFYGIMISGGFHVIIGNPPYIAKAKVRKEYKLRDYNTESCSDIYANVMERVSDLVSATGRTGMIVPLSLTFSGNFAALRALIFSRYQQNWFSSFGRIPSALFSAEVRVRNTIHLGCSGTGTSRQYSTILHRWFEAARPHLFTNLAYTSFNPAPYKGLIPKVGSPALARAYEQCFERTHKTVASAFSTSATEHVLYFKKSAYNWLNFCRKMPPCFDESGRRIAQTQFGAVSFPDSTTRDLAFLFLNGKIMYVFWAAIADDFHVTEWMFADFPIDFDMISKQQAKELKRLVIKLDAAMESNTSYKLNAGKRVGNYNLARCRPVTDCSDAIFAEALGICDVWEDIQLAYYQVVKTNFNDEEESDSEGR